MFTIYFRAVTDTHTFLSDDDLAYFVALMRTYLPTSTFWVADIAGSAVAFLALTDAYVDALFVDPGHHGAGIGRELIEHARDLAGPLTVDVNEQNTGACALYNRVEFHQVGRRSELDDYGKPYPILHLAQR